CENICVICKSILGCSPESLLNQTATLELVQIFSEPSQSLGLEIKSTSSGQHFVGQTTPESPARQCEHILPGDEIIKVNDQVVVGWTQKNLVCKLQEKTNCMTLILKKVSVSPKSLVAPEKRKTHETSSSSLSDRSTSSHASHVPASPNERVPDLLLNGKVPRHECPGWRKQRFWDGRGHVNGIADRPSTRSVITRFGMRGTAVPCIPLWCDRLLEPPSANMRPAISDSSLSKKTDAVVSQQSTRLEASSHNSKERSKSPKTERKLQTSDPDKHSHFHKQTPGQPPRNQRVTKLSRRRVSCRDLGNPDCDGWLWKRKENVSFMSQKWKHCYCVLKKDKLYWYNGPQDEKAEGMLNLSAYYLERPLDSKYKKKYEFQLTQQTFKPFVFAADNLTDMNKWVNCLVKTLQKYKTQANSSHSREEDCYSETEAEDEEHSKTQDVVKKQAVQSPVKKETPGASPVSTKGKGAEGVQMPTVSSTQPQGDDLELMMTCLKQGGVSLIGKKTAMTRDEYRKSFIKRNKNPEINYKVHALRVLQSTLKAKLHELEALNQILEHPNLHSTVFQKWKSEHDQLYGGIEKGSQAAAENAEGSNDKNKQDSDESEASD
ncbi:PREDICTED: connector enhancer of kinase suppressor of ras 1-like, partial [Nanorana parkeri]|uniref:connector enhancer of kinase suppressor of ras 1-like n=1 Tax=Nanorana parkeri TaxID=125878 RepID=UPI000854A425